LVLHRYLKLFGAIANPTLELSQMVTTHLERQQPNDPNAIIQFKVEEYLCYVQQFGLHHEDTLFKGAILYLRSLKTQCKNQSLDKSIHINLCISIYTSLELYLCGLSTEEVEETPTGKLEFRKENDTIISCLLLLAEAFSYLVEVIQPTLDICNVILEFTDVEWYRERVESVVRLAVKRRSLGLEI